VCTGRSSPPQRRIHLSCLWHLLVAASSVQPQQPYSHQLFAAVSDNELVRPVQILVKMTGDDD
jgi:hypothetical protein